MIHNMRRSFIRQLRFSPGLGLCPCRQSHRIAQPNQLLQNNKLLTRTFSRQNQLCRSAAAQQIRSSLISNDLQGAIFAHDRFLAENNEGTNDIPVVLSLLQALCLADRDFNDKIGQILGALSDQQVIVDSTTVAALTQLYLRQGALGSLEELFTERGPELSNEGKSHIWNTLKAYIISQSTSTTAAWESYIKTHSHFARHLTLPVGEELIENFFSRQRADMATLIFTHLHSNPRTTPTMKTFLLALSGLAKTRDIESLILVHNFLKLSTTIDPNTELSDALMRAYIACGLSQRALEVWKQTADSLEGPSYESIGLALEACKSAPGGLPVALAIFRRLRKSVGKTEEHLMAAYAAALVAHGRIDEAKGSVDKWKDGAVTVYTINKMIGAATDTGESQKVEEWAAAKYPGPWKEYLQSARVSAEEEQEQIMRFLTEDDPDMSEEEDENQEDGKP
jgi:hypothetical protein